MLFQIHFYLKHFYSKIPMRRNDDLNDIIIVMLVGCCNNEWSSSISSSLCVFQEVHLLKKHCILSCVFCFLSGMETRRCSSVWFVLWGLLDAAGVLFGKLQLYWSVKYPQAVSNAKLSRNPPPPRRKDLLFHSSWYFHIITQNALIIHTTSVH